MRMKQLQRSNAHKLELLYNIKESSDKEQFVHAKFNEFRLHGEWFEYDKSIIDYFEMLNNETR